MERNEREKRNWDKAKEIIKPNSKTSKKGQKNKNNIRRSKK